MTRRDPAALRLCLMLLRAFALVVPAESRDDWRAEWEAEVRHRWHVLETRHHLTWSTQMNVIRRALGAFTDAAWLRRQFTTDADIVHDVRHGFRMLRKSVVFSASAILILALGIGGTVSIVTLLDTLLFRPLPYRDADRIMTVWQQTNTSTHAEDVAPANFLDWRARSRSFSALAAAVPYSWDYTGGSEPEVLFGARVTEGFWDALGVQPALGRAFVPEDYSARRRVVLVTHGLWVRRFGSDPQIINRSIALDGDVWTIVGVLPKEFAPQILPRPGELAVWAPKIIADYEYRTRGSAWWNVVGRLNDGVSRDQAQAELDTIAAALAQEHPRTNEGSGVRVVSLREHLMGEVRVPLFAMLAAVLLVLGIGCANVASLLLARGVDRQREFAIRAALGAGRARLVRQLVAESLLLSVIAASCGVALAYWGVGAIVALAPGGVLRLHEATIDAPILMFAAALTTLAAMGFGLVPALHFSRSDSELIRERDATGVRRTFRRAIVGAEIAFAVILLTGAGLLLRSFGRLLSVDPGFTPKHVVMLQVFAGDRNDRPERVWSFFDATLERIRALPGVQSAGAVSAMPFATANIDIQSTLEIVGRPAANALDRRGIYVTVATPGYFDAMSIPLREGRALTDSDNAQSPVVGVISEALRRREWAHESPIGKRVGIQWQGNPVQLEVVGVVGELRHDGLDSRPRAEVFIPLAQLPFTSMTYVIRSVGQPSSVIESAKRAVWSVDPQQTIYDTATVEGLVQATIIRHRFSAVLMTAFAVLALVLCATGIYGIISFTTNQRTREIGVRMALGADAQSIRRMVLKEGSLLIGAGLVAGVIGAVVMSRPLRALLFEVPASDPATIVTVCTILISVGLAACYLPARRATRVDPLVALRPEP